MTSKKYYWLKLKNTFFNQKEVKLLRRVAGGDTFTVIYLKMMLLSLEDEGTIFFDNVVDKFEEELALELDEDVDNVLMTLNFLQAKGLLEVKDADEYFLNEVPTMIGKETDSAERMRRSRRRKKEKLMTQSDTVPSLSDSTVTKSYTEIEIDKEIDKEIDVDRERNEETLLIDDKNNTKDKSLDKCPDKSPPEYIDKSLDDDSPNQNSENDELKESSKTNNNDNKLNPLSFYENNGFGTLSPIVRDKIEAISKDFIQEGSSEKEADELIIKALELSAINNVRKWSYAEKVLINWNNKGHKTVKDVDAAEKNYQSRKGNNSYNQLNKTTPEEDEETKEFVRKSKERLAKDVAKYKPEDFDDFF